MVTFGERLRSERNRKKMSLDEMSEDLNTTKATLSRYENNLREPKIEFVKQAADYFDCSTDYLLGRTNNREGLIVKDKVDNDEIAIEVDKNVFPDGLTHEEVVEILNTLKKAGFKWEKKND